MTYLLLLDVQYLVLTEFTKGALVIDTSQILYNTCQNMCNNIYNNEHGSKYTYELKATINNLQLYKTKMNIILYSVGG